MNRSLTLAALLSCGTLLLAGCPNPADEDDGSEAARTGVKNYVNTELTALHEAALALQAAAPAGDADGWNADDDAAAVAEMKTQWKKARVSYERVEGAIAVLFPGLDESTDQRYDGFHEAADFSDDNLFDGTGVTGVHGIERILFADVVPAAVDEYEIAVVGDRYEAPAFPATEAEANDFKTSLAQRLVDDTATMQSDFQGVELALEAAYRGVLGSMEEQFEKVALAGDGSDESRYAQHTLGDMRANLEGGLNIYEAFDPMFDAKEGDGEDTVHEKIQGAFDRVKAQYDGIAGDAIPEVPATWDPDAPSDADAATAYGKLFLFLQRETDLDDGDSFVGLFNQGGELLAIPQLPE